MGTQRSAQPRRGTGSTALTHTPQGHCPRPDWKMVSHITSWSLFILWRHGWKVHPAPRAIKHRQPHPGWIRKEKGWGLNLSGNAISCLVQFLREAMNYVMVVLFLEQITFEQNLCLLLGAISKSLVFVFNNRHKQNGHRERKHGDGLCPSRHRTGRQAELGGLERGQRPLG